MGHVIAERAGHAMHAALVSKIMSDLSLFEMLAERSVHTHPSRDRQEAQRYLSRPWTTYAC
ncbi:MAG: hypothetical protein M3O35_19915 [Acidobacteriota bacterium]|nr:hypothetical protein [Acidobacteriota bacterium]